MLTAVREEGENESNFSLTIRFLMLPCLSRNNSPVFSDALLWESQHHLRFCSKNLLHETHFFSVTKGVWGNMETQSSEGKKRRKDAAEGRGASKITFCCCCLELLFLLIICKKLNLRL